MAPKPPASLVRYLWEGRCVLFAGSGLSAWGGLPTWGRLLGDIVEEVRAEEPDSPDLDEVSHLLTEGKYLEVADYCKERLGKRRYSEVLADKLRGDEGQVPEPHQVIVTLPFAAVVTTNYDKLLERAYGNSPKTPTHCDVDALGPLLFDDSFFILKAHGDIDRPESLVLTAQDYREIIHANPAFNEFFSAILLTNAILFVGYSLSDPDFQLLLDRQLTTFQGYIPERYALMSGVSRVERDVLWRTARIKVLSYEEGKHNELLVFLHTLGQELEAKDKEIKKEPGVLGMAPPATRSKAPLVEIRQPAPLSTAFLDLNLREGELEAAFTGADRARYIRGRGPLPNLSDMGQLFSHLEHKAEQYLTGRESRAIGEELTRCLPEEVLHALGQVPPEHVVGLRPAAELETLPWEWIYHGQDHLCLRNPVVRAPTALSDAARGYPMVQSPARLLLIGDATGELAGARVEVERIADICADRAEITCTTLIGPEATIDAVQRGILAGNYDLIHFAGHAWFDDQEAYLVLHDRVILRANELRPLLSRRPPAILVLNSHFTAFVPPGVRIEQEAPLVPEAAEPEMRSGLRGRQSFMAVANTAGVGAFIGCFASPRDPMAGEIGVSLHQELGTGAPVAVALHRARLAALEKYGHDPLQYMTGLLYVISGYPELVLV